MNQNIQVKHVKFENIIYAHIEKYLLYKYIQGG